MCDFSLHHVKSRPAKVGDKLRTVNFKTGTRGFAAPEDSTTAVCILPGTELAFSEEVKCAPTPFGFSSWRTKTVNFRTAIFRQINKDQPRMRPPAASVASRRTRPHRQNRGKSCHLSGTSPDLRLCNAAAQRRIVSVAEIRPGPRKSVRPFKGIICDDISEFKSYMPSQQVQSLWVMCGTWENARHFGGLARYRGTE
jgi:hypothetical protein